MQQHAGAIQTDVYATGISTKKLLPLQGEGGDGGGVCTLENPTPILTFPLKGKGRSAGLYSPWLRHQFESHPLRAVARGAWKGTIRPLHHAAECAGQRGEFQ